jgi:molybdopterin/thiamine biosynthesis adenylyltransferase
MSAGAAHCALLQDARKLAAKWQLPVPDSQVAPFEREPASVVRLRFGPSTELYLFAGTHYPDLPPHITLNWGDGSDGDFLALAWNRALPETQRLEEALMAHVDPPGPFRIVWGPEIGVPMTTDQARGDGAGWRRFISGKPLAIGGAGAARERVESTIVDALAESRVLIVGLGSVGSYITEQLVRSGVGAVTLVDHDKVEASNLSRTMFSLRDVGRTKVAALTRRLLEINPNLILEPYDATFESVGGERLRGAFQRASLVISVTDDHRVQTLVNRCSFFSQKPAVYVGLYRGAKGGEIIAAVPGMTPCFNCIAASRPRAVDASGQSQEREVDYGTGRLRGEIALGCDIHYVASAGLKIVFSILTLMGGNAETTVSQLMLRALRDRLAMTLFSCEPDYWPAFFGTVFSNTPGQLAFQSVWVSAQSQDGCDVCGRRAGQEDPFPYVRPDPSISDLRAAFR